MGSSLRVTVFVLLCQNLLFAVDSNIRFLTSSQDTFCSRVTKCSAAVANPPPGATNPDNSTETTTVQLLPVLPPPFPSDCCSKCSCEANCVKEGTCCIDALMQLPTLEDARNRLLTTATCELPQLRINDGNLFYSQWKGVLMIRYCDPSNFNLLSSPNTMDKCQNPDKYTDINTQVPVFDASTNISYQNMFCAQCNNVNETAIKFWGVSVMCRFDSYAGVDINTLVEDIRNSRGCNLIYESPDPQARTSCDTELINVCNQTGLWRFYDPFIERACLSYMTIYNFRYKNVFCYMCNVDIGANAPGLCNEMPGPHVFSTFSLLLNLPEPSPLVDHKDEPIGCLDSQILDPVTVSYSTFNTV